MTVSDALRKVFLRETFDRFHHPEYISPDPLEFVHLYADPLDREIAGLVASALAYGRVAQVLKSVNKVFGQMGCSPRAFLDNTPGPVLRERFRGFKHRFTTECELADLFVGIQSVLRRHGTLQACFLSGLRAGDDTVGPALCAFVRELNVHENNGGSNSLIPVPDKNSACKRLHLYLRWMVRSDAVDPGVWTDVSPEKLIVPLDTHMFRTCRSLGMTTRSQADGKTALEITSAFRKIEPGDPVKYDFSLTRIGIRREGDLSRMIETCARAHRFL
ncbi:MAG: TIGR02757 family protein [Desulfomonilia bacterium]|jgi:uncharacterized protein (TIGR02757 family)|nr:TIGR02757 family protein [Deltaproteobacteria bacterium]MDX9760847.1 TIGR02757 family protein [Desulfomonilia bacterium]HPW69118.1 TIGR02757 family protein [Deltaproteobacteria bacterium]